MIRRVRRNTIEEAMLCIECVKPADFLREPFDGDAWCEECAIATGFTLMDLTSGLQSLSVDSEMA